MPVAAQELYGLEITMLDGSKLGRVDAVYIDDDTGIPNWASVKVGVRRHRSLVPLATASQVGTELRVPYGKARIKNAPATDPGAHINRRLEARLREYYGLTAGVGEARAAAGAGERPGEDGVPAQGAVPSAGAVPAQGGVPTEDVARGMSSRPSPIPLPRFGHLQAIQAEGILTVTLDRPPVNALDRSTYAELNRLFSDIDALETDVRAVVLTGTDRYFCAGDDVDELAAATTPIARQERNFHVREALWAVRECQVPVVGAVNGAVLGTGVALAAACDFLVAGADVTFQFPKPGVAVAGGARHLARLLPQPMVRWMYLTGEPVSAARIAAMGAVVRVASRSALAEAFEEARHLASMDDRTIRAAKRALNESETLDLRSGFEAEQAAAIPPIPRAQLRAA